MDPIRWVVLMLLFELGLGAARGAETATLREVTRTDGATHAVIELNASGELRPEAAPGEKAPAPVALRVRSRFDFIERVIATESDGAPSRSVRQARQAATAINGGGRPIVTSLRPEVAILVAEVRESQVFLFSPGGPLTRGELDIVQGPADPMLLGRLLPEKPVGAGDTWDLSAEVAKSLSDYDALASNTLRAKLETLDSTTADIRLAGEIRGAARGGEGVVTIEGTLTFDRVAKLVSKLELIRSEVRKPGQVEPGFEFTGTMTVARTPVEVPARLTDAALEPLPLENQPHLSLLRFIAPDDAFTFLHDRDWHLIWDDERLAVFKRLDHGEFLAQCNLADGPKAAPGRHQDPVQFKADIRAAIGERFVAFLGEEEVGPQDDRVYRYRIAVQGRDGDRGILWYYYLIASPEGEQLLGTFTLNADDMQRFGNQDLELIGSLEWRAGGK